MGTIWYSLICLYHIGQAQTFAELTLFQISIMLLEKKYTNAQTAYAKVTDLEDIQEKGQVGMVNLHTNLSIINISLDG